LYKKAEVDGMYTDFAAAGRCQLALLRAACAQPNPFAAVRGVSEGLDHRLENAVRQYTTLPALLDELTTVRYPRARMRRLAMDAALGYTAALPALPPYLHLLGARREALPLLKHTALPLWQGWNKKARNAPALQPRRQRPATLVLCAAKCPGPWAACIVKKLSF